MHFLEATGKWQFFFINLILKQLQLLWSESMQSNMSESVHFYSNMGKGFSLLAVVNQSFYLCVCVCLKMQYSCTNNLYIFLIIFMKYLLSKIELI